MSDDLTNDAQGHPGPGFPGISVANLRRARRWDLPFIALVLLLLVLWWARGVYTDVL